MKEGASVGIIRATVAGHIYRFGFSGIIILAFLILFLPSPAPGAITVTSSQERISLSQYTDILIDPKGEMGINDVTSPHKAQDFLPATQTSNATHRNIYYWLRLTFDNSTNQPLDKVLSFGETALHQLTLYVPKPGGGYRVRQIDIEKALYQSDIVVHQTAFSLILPPNSGTTIYVRMYKATQIKPMLWDPGSFVTTNEFRTAIYGLAGGIILLAAMYQLVIILMTRDVPSLRWSFFAFSTCAYILDI